MKQKTKVGVIGAGPAGLISAVIAAQNGADVTIFERNDKIGKKILATGNGKCNFSNKNLSIDNYEGSVKEIFQKVYDQYPRETFEDMLLLNGVLIKDKNGYLYPNTEQAATIVDWFLSLLELYHISVYTDTLIKADDIQAISNGFQIQLNENCHKRNNVFDSLIVATGGKAAPKTGSDGIGFEVAKKFGHTIVPVVPALVQLRCSDSYCKALAGVRADANISLYENDQFLKAESGEVQLTDYGISGIPIFQLSRYAAYALKRKSKVSASIDFLKDYEEKELISIFQKKLLYYKEMSESMMHMTIESFFHGFINKKITLVILKECQMKPSDSLDSLSNGKIRDFVRKCKHFMFHITDTNSFEQAQVSAGGIPVTEIHEDLSSQFNQNLYFAGEILDLDGQCGGYNIQWAFSSGAVAGKSASTMKRNEAI